MKKQINKKKLLITIISIILVCGTISGIVTGSLYASYKNKELSVPIGFTVTAHTGPEGTPYNSIEGMEKGIASGADIIEFDLNLYNETPVCCHNKPKGGETLFEDALKVLVANPLIKANIDVKESKALYFAYPLIVTYNLQNRVFFTGIKEDYVATVKDACPGINYYLNMTPRLSTSDKYYQSVAEKIKDLGAIGINCNYNFVNKKLVDTLHEEGLLVSVWTANDKFAMYKMLALGPDNITTKQPTMLISIIDEKK